MRKQHMIHLFKYVLPFFCGILLLAGCSQDDIPAPNNGKEEGELVDITINVQAADADALTKGDINEGANGAGNVDWEANDLRYIMEIWRRDISPNYVVQQTVILTDDIRPIQFNAKLVAGFQYDFLFWADVVPAGSTADHYYQTIYTTDNLGLKSVYRNDYKTASDDRCDAFTAATTQIIGTTLNPSITLTRPLAKLITTITNIDGADSLTVKYTNIPHTYDVATKKPFEGGSTSSVTFSAKPENGQFQLWDYIISPKAPTDTTTQVEYTVSIFKGGKLTYGQKFSNITLAANKLTKVNANMLASFKRLYTIGDYYEKGTVKGVIYQLTENNGINQTFNIFSMDEPVNSMTDWPYDTTQPGMVKYDTANTFATSKGNGWKIPSLTEMNDLTTAMAGYYPTFINTLAAKGGTPLLLGGGGNNWQAYWTSTPGVTAGYNHVKGLLDGNNFNDAEDSKTNIHFVRAILTGLTN